ncbi:outer membrane beta-barrel family protein [Mucilaginibacter polytrichastri]|nr:outer membrane beta-barrel family protein [Mucilaginibacter polytrichastri]
MMNKQFILIFCLMGLLAIQVKAQISEKGKITGKIIDEHKNPFGYATINLLKAADSTFIKGSSSNDKGTFTLDAPEGSYIFSISVMGYLKIVKGPYSIKADQKVFSLGDIQLTPAAQQLAGVSIVYRKPLIERQVDKTVLNIENSSIAAGNTALEILQKAPGVSVGQNGLISLKGKQGVTIMLDGKPTYLSGEDLTNLLNATQGSEIKTIELITNPSSKYDAAGTAGIINIRMKRNKNFGTNGSVALGAGYGKFAKENGDVTINHREAKLNVFANLSYNHNERWLDNDITRINNTVTDPTYFTQTGRTIGQRYNTNYKAGLDYFINSRNTLGFAVNGNSGNANDNGNVLTLIGNRPMTTDSVVRANNTATARNRNITYNLNYKGVLDTLGQEINMDMDYSVYNRDRLDSYNNFFSNAAGLTTGPADIFRNFTPAKVRIWAVKADYTYSITKDLKFNAGLKSSYVKTDNNSIFQNFLNNNWQADNLNSNHFIYSENINAAYGSVQQEFKNTTVQLGLRAEQTNSNGNSLTSQSVVASHYLNLFPSVFINHVLSTNNEVGFSYSRRIDRPDYASLNPFIKFVDLYTYAVGNPYLRPQFTNSFELSYAYNKTFNVTFGYNHTNDVISQVVTTDTVRKTLYNTPQNIARYTSFDFNFDAPVTITSWWTTNNSLTAFYGRFSSPDLLGMPYSSGRVVFSFNTIQTVMLTPTMDLEVSGRYRTRGLEGTFTIQSQHRLDAGISKSLLSKKLNFKFAVDDLLNSWKLVTNSTLPSQNYNNYVKAESRIARLTCSYRFGSNNIKAARQHQKSSDEEQNRVRP